MSERATRAIVAMTAALNDGTVDEVVAEVKAKIDEVFGELAYLRWIREQCGPAEAEFLNGKYTAATGKPVPTKWAPK